MVVEARIQEDRSQVVVSLASQRTDPGGIEKQDSRVDREVCPDRLAWAPVDRSDHALECGAPQRPAALGVVDSERVAIAVGFNDVSMLGIPSGGGMTLPFAVGGGGPVRLEPTDIWPTRALAVGAYGIAQEVVARLMLRLNSRR